MREYFEKSHELWGEPFQEKLRECAARKDQLKGAAVKKVREDDLFRSLRPGAAPK